MKKRFYLLLILIFYITNFLAAQELQFGYGPTSFSSSKINGVLSKVLKINKVEMLSISFDGTTSGIGEMYSGQIVTVGHDDSDKEEIASIDLTAISTTNNNLFSVYLKHVNDQKVTKVIGDWLHRDGQREMVFKIDPIFFREPGYYEIIVADNNASDEDINSPFVRSKFLFNAVDKPFANVFEMSPPCWDKLNGILPNKPWVVDQQFIFLSLGLFVFVLLTIFLVVKVFQLQSILRKHQVIISQLQHSTAKEETKAEIVPLKIALPQQNETRYINISDIIRCEADNTYAVFYLTNGDQILVSKPLKEYSELLKPHGFLRVHQSHLINPEFVKSWLKEDGGMLLMKNGDKIPVSKPNRESVKAVLQN